MSFFLPNRPAVFGLGPDYSELARIDNVLQQSDDSGVTFRPVRYVDLRTRSLLAQQAGVVCGLGFAEFWVDGQTGAEGLAVPSTVGLTATPSTGAFSSAGKISYSMAGASGFAGYRPSSPLSLGGPTGLVSDASVAPWYQSFGGAITAVSANGELGLCGWVCYPDILGTDDASSGVNIMLGVFGTQSTTRLLVKAWDGTTAKYTDTGITLDIGACAYHHYGWCMDLSTIYVIYDGVVLFSMPVGQLFTSYKAIGAANPCFVYRTTTATVQTVIFDYLYAAGPRP